MIWLIIFALFFWWLVQKGFTSAGTKATGDESAGKIIGIVAVLLILILYEACS